MIEMWCTNYSTVTNKTKLVCDYMGEIISSGYMWKHEEFYYIEILGQFPETFYSMKEINDWFLEHPNWKVEK